jgi:hypothetical protein
MIIIVFGITLAIFKNTLLSPLINDIFGSAFWTTKVIDEGTIKFKNLTWSLFGAVMTCWGILLLGIVNNSFKKQERWAWNSILLSTLGWFVIDESFSIYYHVWVNAIGNIPLFIAIIFPLIMTKKEMKT